MSIQPPPQTVASVTARRGRVAGVALLVVGILGSLVGLGLLAGGGVLMAADRTMRDAAGYLTSPTTQLSASSYAIAATDLNVAVSSPDWHVSADALGSVRFTATAADPSKALFLGIAPRDAVLQYLNGVSYQQLTGYTAAAGGPTYQAHDGGSPGLPASQQIWRATASGVGMQTLTWTVGSGQWAVVLMNADASPGVAADVAVGATAPFLFALALGLLIGGAVVALVAVLLFVAGVRLMRRHQGPVQSPTWAAPPPAPPGTATPPPPAASALGYPLRIEGRLDAEPSRWLWLVKWFLLIPHYIVLGLLLIASALMTAVAFVAIVVTGRYPRPIFDFNVGVLRWWWRVDYYGYGALGTDRYPPFSLGSAAGYPARLDVPYPARLSRGLVFVKWLLAIPHYMLLSAFLGGAAFAVQRGAAYAGPYSGLISALVLIAAVGVLFTARYSRGIFDLVMGLNRWVYRVVVYSMLLRDEYPPFRLDMGGEEQPGGIAAPAWSTPPPPSMQPRRVRPA
jgi:Domain of unknown function (DUF4389)